MANSVHHWILVAAVLAVVLSAGGALAGASTLALRPGMPAISELGVPMLYEAVPDADRVEPRAHLSPQSPYQWVAPPGGGLTAKVAVEPGARGERGVLTVWDWNRVPVAQSRFAVPFEETVAFEVGGRGTYLLTLDLFAADKCVARLARSFSVCPDNRECRKVWREDEFFVGTCSFPGRQNWPNDYGPAHPADLSEEAAREMDADLAARLGLQVVRPDLPVFWPSESAPIDFGLADKCIVCFASRGFKLDLQVGAPGDWAISPRYRDVKDPKWRYPPREEPQRRFIAAIARRYARYAAFFEVYNEPDNQDFWRGTPEEYIAFNRWTAEEIRRAAPKAIIANGGYTMLEPAATGLIARGVHGTTDLVAYHAHGGVQLLREMFHSMQAVHAAAGYRKPVFINTEMGYAAWRLDQEREMAATAVQKLLFCWAHGNRGALLYCSRDIGGPRLRGDDWGFIDYTMCPRFAYGAVAAFIDAYAGARFEGILRETDQLHVYSFRDAGRHIVSLFTPDGAERPVILESDSTRAYLVDPMGNRTPVPNAQSVEVTASLYPTALIFEGGKQPPVVAE
jgi:hypothetical protein